jgi:hypothetical protein
VCRVGLVRVCGMVWKICERYLVPFCEVCERCLVGLENVWGIV